MKKTLGISRKLSTFRGNFIKTLNPNLRWFKGDFKVFKNNESCREYKKTFRKSKILLAIQESLETFLETFEDSGSFMKRFEALSALLNALGNSQRFMEILHDSRSFVTALEDS